MSLRHAFLIGIAAAALAGPAAGQPAGKTNEDFVLTYFAGYGGWEIFCGNWGEPQSAQCDLRRQDVYSPRPDFRASVTFIRVGPNDIRFDIGLEAASSLVGGGLRAVDGSWTAPTAGCVIGTCRLRGAAAEALIEDLQQGVDATLSFTDYGVQAQAIVWDNGQFAQAWEDFERQRSERDLP